MPALLTQATVHACPGDLAADGTSRAGRRPRRPDPAIRHCLADLRSRPCKFASAPSASSQPLLLIWDPSKASLIVVRAIAAGGTDDADGADGVFSARAHPDHSGPQPAFTRERDLDTKRSQELPAVLFQTTVHACSGDLAALGTSRASRAPPQDQTQQSGTALPRSSITALQVCVCARPASARGFFAHAVPPETHPEHFPPTNAKGLTRFRSTWSGRP